jgi:hypothetical protein
MQAKNGAMLLQLHIDTDANLITAKLCESGQLFLHEEPPL